MHRERHPGRWAVALALSLALALPGLSGCGPSKARRDARAGFVDQLVNDGGVPEDLARCIVDRYFAAHSDEELATFFETSDASQAERDEFAALTKECVAELAS